MAKVVEERSVAGSYVSGRATRPLLGATIGGALECAAGRWPDRPALVVCEQGVRLSYRQLNEKAAAIACGLLDRGLNPGDRIGIWSPNNLEWVLTQFAAAKAGLVLVSLNPAYRSAEIAHALTTVGCKALVCATSHKSSRYLDILAEIAPELKTATPGDLHAAALPKLNLVVQIGSPLVPGAIAFEDLEAAKPLSGVRLAEIEAGLSFDAPTNIQFTSGTTGLPKGATLTHHNILNNGFFVGEAIGLTEQDKVCIPVPFYHCFGMVMGNLACINHGAAMVIPGAAFEPGATLSAVESEGCTALYGVPTMFIAMLAKLDEDAFRLGTLRTGIMAGAPCPIEIMQRVVNQLGIPEITIAYGMTETSPVSFQTGRDDTLERRVSTVGRIQPHLDAKIVDENGAIVPRGTAGELCTRGYSVMHGYWGDPERTAEAIDKAGWMHTGDLATIDDDGYCNIVGRLKDMVIRGGENISPREIEEFLHTHPDILDVQVFGVPDPKYGEELCAWIRLADMQLLAEEDIRAYCRGRIAHYKVPRYVRFVDAFPMTVTGKVQKFVMRQLMRDQLALAETRTA